VRPTDPEDPVFVYEPEADRAVQGFAGRGPVIMAVYNLPAELPLESSVLFSGVLKGFVPAIARADFRAPLRTVELPEAIRRSMIITAKFPRPSGPRPGR
jgi:hypothetical protein